MAPTTHELQSSKIQQFRPHANATRPEADSNPYHPGLPRSTSAPLQGSPIAQLLPERYASRRIKEQEKNILRQHGSLMNDPHGKVTNPAWLSRCAKLSSTPSRAKSVARPRCKLAMQIDKYTTRLIPSDTKQSPPHS